MAAGASKQGGGDLVVAAGRTASSGLQRGAKYPGGRSCLPVVKAEAVEATSLCMEGPSSSDAAGDVLMSAGGARLIGGTMSTGGSLAVSSGAGSAGASLTTRRLLR